MDVNRRTWRAAVLPASWCLLVVDMLWVRHRDPFGRSPTHPGYGENLPGDLPWALFVSAMEVVVLTAILEPWRAKPLWPRAFVALALFAPWSLFALMMGMHAGSIDAAHAVWRLGLVLAIGAVLLISGARAIVRSLRHRSDQGAGTQTR